MVYKTEIPLTLVQVRKIPAFFILFFLAINIRVSSATTLYEYEDYVEFHLDDSDPDLSLIIPGVGVANDGIIYFECTIYDNSTNDVTLSLYNGDAWNLSDIVVPVGGRVNATVTNGNQHLDPDVSFEFAIIITRHNVTDEIWGSIFLGVITYGWDRAPWPLSSVILVLILFSLKRLQTKKRKNLD